MQFYHHYQPQCCICYCILHFLCVFDTMTVATCVLVHSYAYVLPSLRAYMCLVSEHSVLQSPGQLFVCFSHVVASLAR